MKVCLKCGKSTASNQTTCLKCKENLVDIDTLTPSQASELSEKLHSLDVVEYDKGQNAMCFVVLGGIALIIGALFIVLSLKRKNNAIVGFNFASIQFAICIVSFVVGGLLLGYGLVKVILANMKRKQYKETISIISTKKSKN